MNEHEHIVSSYEEELSTLNDKIARMGGLSEQLLGNAIDALERRDPTLAETTIQTADRDDVTVLLIPRTERYSGIGSAFFYVRDVDNLYSEMLASGADVQGEPISQPWGIRMFSVVDVEGNRLGFGQTFE